MYKLIAIDLDGTLLNDDKEISKEDKDYLIRISNDFEIVFITGRRYFTAYQYGKEIIPDMNIITSGGTSIRNIKTGKKLYGNYMDMDSYREMIDFLEEENYHPIVHIDNFEGEYDMLIDESKLDSYMGYGSYEDRIKSVKNFRDLDYPILNLIVVDGLEGLEILEAKINKEFSSRYLIHIIKNVSFGGAILEIKDKKGDKWTGLSKYIEAKNIKGREVIAIGDDNNDLSMIKNSGLGIAMINGSEEVRQAGDIITDKDNNNSGVSDILRKVLEYE